MGQPAAGALLFALAHVYLAPALLPLALAAAWLGGWPWLLVAALALLAYCFWTFDGSEARDPRSTTFFPARCSLTRAVPGLRSGGAASGGRDTFASCCAHTPTFRAPSRCGTGASTHTSLRRRMRPYTAAASGRS